MMFRGERELSILSKQEERIAECSTASICVSPHAKFKATLEDHLGSHVMHYIGFGIPL